MEIEKEDKHILLKTGKLSSKLEMQSDIEDFPEKQDILEEPIMTIPAEELIKAFDKTLYASSNDEARYFLQAVGLDNNNGKLTFVATDGKRLAIYNADVDLQVEFTEYLVNQEAIKLILKIHKQYRTSDEVKIYSDNNKIKFVIHGFEVVSSLIEGQFPNWKIVVPEKTDWKIELSRKDFLEQLKDFKPLVNPLMPRVILKNKIVNPLEIIAPHYESDKITLKESYIDKIEAVISHNFIADFLISPNLYYLLEAIEKSTEEDIIVLKILNHTNPIIIENITDTNYFGVVMPMALLDEDYNL